MDTRGRGPGIRFCRAALVAAALSALAAGCRGAGDVGQRAPKASATSTSTVTPVAVFEDTPCGRLPAYQEPWPQRPRYVARLQVDVARAAVIGTVRVSFTPDAPTDRIVFRLWPNAPRLVRAGGRLDVTGATLDGTQVAGVYERGGGPLPGPGTIYTVPLPAPARAGRRLDVELGFSLALPEGVSDRVARSGASVRLGSVIPMLSWVRGFGWQSSPAVDAFAEAAASEVADYDVTVEAPPGFSVLATGEQRSPGRFVATAVRDWAGTVGRLTEASAPAQGGEVEVIVGVAAGAPDDPGALARRAAVAVDGMARRFGRYPYRTLSIGVTQQLSGGIEFPQHILLGSSVSTEHLVHEIAHQWFYGLVGNDQYSDPWLDEGVAKYADARVDGRLAAVSAVAVPPVGQGRFGESMAFWEGRTDAYFRSVYVQGAQVLAALGAGATGLDAVDCGLRRYVHMQAYAVARPAHLAAALTEELRVDVAPTLGLPPAPAPAPGGRGNRAP